MTKKTLLILSCAGVLLLGGGMAYLCPDWSDDIATAGDAADPFPTLNESNFEEHIANSRMQVLYGKFKTLQSHGPKAADMRKQGGGIIDALMDWDRRNTPFSPKEKKLRDMFIAKLLDAGAKPNLYSLRAADNEPLARLMLRHADVLSNLNADGYEKERWGHMVRFQDALADCRSLTVARFLVKNGANTKIPLEDFSSEIVAEYMKSKGCKIKNASLRTCGTVVAAKCIIRKGMNLNGKDRSGDTLLHLHYHNPGFVKLLLRHGANPRVKNNDGLTALDLAVRDGVMESAKILLKHHTDINGTSKDGATLLCRAVEGDHAELAALLIKKGAKVNQPGRGNRTPLHIAVDKGHPACVKLLLEKRADAEMKDDWGDKPLDIALRNAERSNNEILHALASRSSLLPPLHLAAALGNLEAVKKLVDAGTPVDTKAEDGGTAMRLAAIHGRLDVAEYLLDAGADINNSVDGWSALHAVAARGQADAVQLLLKHGAAINVKDKHDHTPVDLAEKSENERTKALLNAAAQKLYGTTPLHRAAERGDLQEVQRLVKGGADLHAKMPQGHTAMRLAVDKGHAEVVRYLLEQGADPDDEAGSWTSLHVAAWNKREDLVVMLLQHGADPQVKDNLGRTALDISRKKYYSDISRLLQRAGKSDGGTLLIQAARRGDLAGVKKRMADGADVNAQTNKGEFPLGEAVTRNHVDVVRYLLEHGADPNMPMNSETLLHQAVINDNLPIVKLLVQHGAAANKKNNSGRTPLQLTSKNQNRDIAKYLLAATAKETNWTLLHQAVDDHSLEKVKAQIAAGADVNAQDIKGTTPLRAAVYRGLTDIVRCLLENGANPNIPTQDGMTPLHVAARSGKMEMLKMMLEHGGNLNVRNGQGLTPIDMAPDSLKEEIRALQRR